MSTFSVVPVMIVPLWSLIAGTVPYFFPPFHILVEHIPFSLVILTSFRADPTLFTDFKRLIVSYEAVSVPSLAENYENILRLTPALDGVSGQVYLLYHREESCTEPLDTKTGEHQSGSAICG
jgi:hypothetical protein